MEFTLFIEEAFHFLFDWEKNFKNSKKKKLSNFTQRAYNQSQKRLTRSIIPARETFSATLHAREKERERELSHTFFVQQLMRSIESNNFSLTRETARSYK